VEASSLFRNSYPIEVGWSFDDLSGSSFLVKPAHGWREWNWRSEEIHGLKHAELVRFGVNVQEASHRLNKAFDGKLVFCDTVDEDGNGGTDLMWLERLHKAAGVPMRYRLLNVNVALGLQLNLADEESVQAVMPRLARAEEMAERHYPHTHQAGEDTVAMAASFRMTADETFMQAVHDHDGRSPRHGSMNDGLGISR
jgi:hypothetical protein